jgi:hypothetical protein
MCSGGAAVAKAALWTGGMFADIDLKQDLAGFGVCGLTEAEVGAVLSCDANGVDSRQRRAAGQSAHILSGDIKGLGCSVARN